MKRRRRGKRVVDRAGRPGLLGQPGFEFVIIVGKRIEIKRRCELPLPVPDMQKAVVVQVIVDIRDQHVEYDAPPQFGLVVPGVRCDGDDAFGDFGVGMILIA